MKLGNTINRVAVATLLVSTAGAPVAASRAVQTASARGIYLGGTKLAIAADIEIDRDGQRGLVPGSFEFKSGDKFWLHLTVNRDAYVYVLNRTLTGSTATSRGIKLMAEADRVNKVQPADTYMLVYPAAKSAPQRVRAATTTRLPGGGLYFTMDQVPGAEKLLIIASATPLNIPLYFNPDGKLRPGSTKNDSTGTVLERLNAELVEMAGNTETEEPASTRDIKFVPDPFAKPGPPGKTADKTDQPKSDPSSGDTTSAGRGKASGSGKPPAPPKGTYAAPRKPSVPVLLELTLRHVDK